MSAFPGLSNLVAYWRLDEAEGNPRADAIGTITLVEDPAAAGGGSCPTRAGKFGRGLRIAGTNPDYVGTLGGAAAVAFTTGSFTVQGWFAGDQTGGVFEGARIDSHVSDFSLTAWFIGVFSDGNARFSPVNQAQVAFPAITPFVFDDEWHRVIGWYDGSDDSVHVQVDAGVPVSAAGPTALATLPTPGLLMYGGAGVGVSGLDEVAVWNRVLTAAEIEALWNGGAGVILETGACLASNELAITLARAGMLRACAGRAGFAPLEDLVDTDVKTYEWTSRPQPGKQPPLNSVIPTWTTTRR